MFLSVIEVLLMLTLFWWASTSIKQIETIESTFYSFIMPPNPIIWQTVPFHTCICCCEFTAFIVLVYLNIRVIDPNWVAQSDKNGGSPRIFVSASANFLLSSAPVKLEQHSTQYKVLDSMMLSSFLNYTITCLTKHKIPTLVCIYSVVVCLVSYHYAALLSDLPISRGAEEKASICRCSKKGLIEHSLLP